MQTDRTCYDCGGPAEVVALAGGRILDIGDVDFCNPCYIRNSFYSNQEVAVTFMDPDDGYILDYLVKAVRV